MDKNKLFIHIGTHKTGSSAIQFSLHKHKKALREERLVYLPNPKGIEAFMAREELDNSLIQTFRDYLDYQIAKEQKKGGEEIYYVMSYEGFSGNPSIGYKNTDVIAEHIKRFTKNMEVYIIAYLRRQDTFVESLYTQKVHEGASYSFQSFTKSISPATFDWDRLLSCYARRFGKENMVVRRYDKAFLPEGDSLLNDFFSTFGIDFRNLASQNELLKVNRGYSRNALEIARLCNPYLDGDEKQSLRKILQKTSTKQPFEAYSFWPGEERDEFLAQYSKSNARVAKEYFNKPSGELFPIPDTWDSHLYPGLSLEDVVPILIKAMLTSSQKPTNSFVIRAIEKIEHKVIGWLKKFPWPTSKTWELD